MVEGVQQGPVLVGTFFTRHSDRISDRKVKGRRQEGNRASGDREATGKRQERATGEREGKKDRDRRAEGGFFATGRRQKGDRKATGVQQKSDGLVEEDKGDKIGHGFLYRWIYVKKMRTNVLHLCGFLLRCHFIISGIDL